MAKSKRSPLREGAQKQMLEELFYDVYRDRKHIYRINFLRGIFFGIGTILGGTVLVAFLVWLLSQMAGWFPPVSDLVNGIIEAIQEAK